VGEDGGWAIKPRRQSWKRSSSAGPFADMGFASILRPNVFVGLSKGGIA